MISITKEQQELLSAYEEVKSKIRIMKEIEANLNNKIAKAFPPTDRFSETNKHVFDNVVIKINRSFNYNFDPEVLDAIESDLTDEEADCVVYKPRLSVSKYKKCNHKTLDHALIVTPAKPVIKISYEE